ncbi:hypothetical protein C8R47DRAFT_1085581 [Mycena vitilis]|nr:hypothetical protein C8R47DRAFT_1085581 [Mycena vitilis]
MSRSEAQVPSESLQAYSPPTASERASLAADRVRCAEIDAQILELELSPQALIDERKLLQDRLDAYIYPVLTLPNEIVSEIFIHFLPIYPKCPPPIGPLSPYLLCHICRKWADIALETPELWRAISLSPPRQQTCAFEKDSHWTFPLLNTSLELSASCPLSITLLSMAEGNYRHLLTRKLVNHCARWEHVELTFTAHETPNFPSNVEIGFPFLRSLKLRAYSLPPVSFRAAPLLRKIELEIYHEGCLPIFPWSRLTVLSVEYIDARHCCYLINQLASIVYCRLIIVTVYAGIPSLRDFTLPYLETLIIDDPFSVRWNIIDALTLPSLRRLQLNNTFGSSSTDLDHHPVHCVASLVTRSGCSLRQLCIAGLFSGREEDFRRAPEFSSVVLFIFEIDGKLEETEAFLRESNSTEEGDDKDSIITVGSPTDSESEWSSLNF